MSDKFRNDLTQGSVTKNLIKFALPFLASNVLQALYSVVDMIVVGQFCGKAGITGVSIGGQINILITGAASGLAVSGTILVAQFLGAKKYEDQKKTIGTMSTMYLVFGIVVTAVMLLVGEGLLRLLKTPESAFSETLAYLNICMAGTLFMFGYNTVCAVLRGLGDSKRPLYFVIIATIINVILDVVLVGKFNMGAAGAAYATIFAQAISFILAVVYLLKTGFFKGYNKSYFKIEKSKASLLVKIGLPSAVQSLVISLSFMTLTALVNSLPNAETAAAVQGIGGKINSFAILPGLAISSAISSMAGQNIGAGQFERAKKTMKVGLALSVVLSLIMLLIVELFPSILLRAFTEDPDVIETGIRYLRFIAIDYIFVGFMFSFNGLAIGAGDTQFALFNSFFNSIIVRVPFAYTMVYFFRMGFDGVGLAIGCASVFSVFIGLWYVHSNKWQKSKVIVAND